MSARFEVVRSDAEPPWHARFVAANGRTVWSTEQYGERKSALNAISCLAELIWVEGVLWAMSQRRRLEIREMDERTNK